MPDNQLTEVENLDAFAGMLVFDKWSCNTNGRQTIFRWKSREEQDPPEARYQTFMIDQGFCFNAGEWNFPDAPLRGLYARNKVYEGVVGRESFGLWLHRLDKNVTEGVFDELVGEIPPEWYDDDLDSLLHLAEQLYRRRSNVPGLLLLFR